MDKKDLIPVAAIGGALAFIIYLSQRNKETQQQTLPYGWGSFQYSNNPLQPVYTTPLPYPVPSPIPITPLPTPIYDFMPTPTPLPYPVFPPYPIDPIQHPAPPGITSIPIASKNLAAFKPLSGNAVRNLIKPVTGKKVI